MDAHLHLPHRPGLVSRLEDANFTALPSPDEHLGAPSPGAVVPRSNGPVPTQQPQTSLESPLHPFPLPTAAPFTLPTPDEPPPGLQDVDFAFSSVLPAPLTPAAVKVAHNLRLPSFETLGIAAPHPDRLPLYSGYSFSSLGAGPLSKPEDPLHALSSPPLGRFPRLEGNDDPTSSSPCVAKAPIEQLVPVMTPPSEPGMLNWGAFVNVRTAGVGSPPSSDSGVSPNLTVTANASSSGNIVPMVVEMSDAIEKAAWIQAIKGLLTSCLPSDSPSSIKVLSHALPCPSLTGHLFGHLIAAIHESTLTNTSWINVFHAVPGRFTLSDLPKSPPSTPGPAVGGDEYFTSKVFDSAVAVPDYQLDSRLLPPSPRPVVAPGSVNISVVERYIPPTNTNEFAEMFAVKGKSLLHDRLLEVSTDNGLLLFIYPTKSGAQTFMKEYLGPILDPLLRSITVVHELSADLGRNLGQMQSVERLIEYASLHAEIEKFCEKLSTPSLTTSLETTTEKKAQYTLVHAAKEEIMLIREVWADWWIKQEKPRVREVVTMNFRKARRESRGGTGGAVGGPAETDLTPSNLIQEVLDGVAHRDYEAGYSRSGIEVGVFIIKKTL